MTKSPVTFLSLSALAAFLPSSFYAQQAALPDAPQAQLVAQAAPSAPMTAPPSTAPVPSQAPVVESDSQTPAKPRLTLADAERIALQHNPNISIARLLQLAAVQGTREARSAQLPAAQVDLTAVDAHDNSRITAGALNNPTIYNRAAGGISVRQLITDFGRTRNLVQSAESNAKAQAESQRASVEDITLAVDEAYYQALTAQSVLKVAQQTVAARQATGEQISALTSSKLRSTLDLSLANVQVSQAQLLVIDAQNATETAMAGLVTILGSEADTRYDLVDETPSTPQAAPQNPEDLVQLAMHSRPDLAALEQQFTAAKQFSAAERDLQRPTISALGVGGATPVRADQIASPWYGAAGANVTIPIFNGFLYSARAREAGLRAQAAGEQVRNLRDTIARDVRTSVLNAQMAFRRISVTQQLLEQANTAMELAQARYKVGLAGIVELTQSQLAQTEAQIGYTNARYAYQAALAALRFQTGQ